MARITVVYRWNCPEGEARATPGGTQKNNVADKTIRNIGPVLLKGKV